MRGQETGEPFPEFRAGFGQHKAHLLGPVGGQHPRPAGVGHDGDAASLDRRHVDQALAQIEHLLDRVDPDGPTLPQHGVVDGIGAGHRAGVGEGRPPPRTAAARLDDYQRLVAGELVHRPHKGPPVGDAFYVQRHHLRLRVLGQVGQEVNLVQVGAVAVTDELGEAQPLLLRPGEDGSP